MMETIQVKTQKQQSAISNMMLLECSSQGEYCDLAGHRPHKKEPQIRNTRRHIKARSLGSLVRRKDASQDQLHQSRCKLVRAGHPRDTRERHPLPISVSDPTEKGGAQ